MPSLPIKSTRLGHLLDSPDSHLIKQGAEAKVYLAAISGEPVILKHRFPKAYRHPTLDQRLTKARLTSEARCLAKALASGVQVPRLRCLDLDAGILGVEFIKGKSVREVLGVQAEGALDTVHDDAAVPTYPVDIPHSEMLAKVGQQLARLHLASIVHGDLTTSNMLITHDTLQCILIDFGLAYVSTLVEDKAVDLYVLERAFLSTHPDDSKSIHRSTMFEQILQSYALELGDKTWKPIKTRLDEVRMRGRKRSMVG